jgi:hypothetical protein
LRRNEGDDTPDGDESSNIGFHDLILLQFLILRRGGGRIWMSAAKIFFSRR